MGLKAKASSIKEKYEPPTVRRVRIVPDELAVAGCKVNQTTLGPAANCQQFAFPCRDAGS